jgi:hypothetical protein
MDYTLLVIVIRGKAKLTKLKNTSHLVYRRHWLYYFVTSLRRDGGSSYLQTGRQTMFVIFPAPQPVAETDLLVLLVLRDFCGTWGTSVSIVNKKRKAKATSKRRVKT